MEKKIIGGVELRANEDGRWFSEDGVEFAIADDGLSADPIVRCGVGKLSLPVDFYGTDGCKSHDYLTSSATYQEYHTRSEGDGVLLEHELILAGKNPLKRAVAYALWGLSRLASWKFWENAKTRWK